AGTDDASERRRRSVVNEHARRDRRAELLHLDVEAVAGRIRAGLDEHVAASELAPLDARQGDRHSLSGSGGVDRLVVDVHATDADVAAARLGAERVAGGDPARPERPGRHGADAAEREDAVDVQAGRRLLALAFSRGARERGAELVEPGARL